MRSIRRTLLSLLASGLLLLPAIVQSQAAGAPVAGRSPSAIDRESLDEARGLLKTGEYDRVIELLRTAIDQASIDSTAEGLELLREAYLLLIKTYVTRGNFYRFEPQARETSDLYYREAREIIVECLDTWNLRHTRPDPPSEYPPEMLDFFREVRSGVFGAFRVIELGPADALVYLDGRLLAPESGGRFPEDTDLAVGEHQIVVRSGGFDDLIDQVLISPSSTLERHYSLTRKRGMGWYLRRGTAFVAGAIALGFLIDDEHRDLKPLPEPPPPPN